MKNKKLWIFIGLVVLIMILNHMFGWSAYLGDPGSLDFLEQLIRENMAGAIGIYLAVTVIGSVVLSLGAFIIYDYISKKERTHDTKIKLILVFVCLLVYEMVALLLNQPTITMHIGVLVGMIVVLIAGYRFFSARFEDRRERR